MRTKKSTIKNKKARFFLVWLCFFILVIALFQYGFSGFGAGDEPEPSDDDSSSSSSSSTSSSSSSSTTITASNTGSGFDPGDEPEPEPPDDTQPDDLDDDGFDPGDEPEPSDDDSSGDDETPTPTPSPTPTPTPTPTPSPSPTPSCSPGWVCVDSHTRAKQHADCSLSHEKTCDYGCENGKCKHRECTEGWKCMSEVGKPDWRGYQKKNCSWKNEEFCETGCENGECRCVPKSCSDFSGCGEFDNGCGETIDCTDCGYGKECVNGKCECAPDSCESLGYECGTAPDGCNGTLNCGECRKGFECNGWHQCKKAPEKLEITNIQVFAYSTYAIVSWQSGIEATSLVKFGKTKEKLTDDEKKTGKTAEHSILLHNLSLETTYYYKVSSSANGKTAESKIRSFKTKFGDEKLRVLFIAVSPASKTQFEGQSFSFTAVTNALHPEELEFEWSFGDGSTGSGERAFHSYYGLSAREEKNFTVSVRVKDKNGNTASESVTVTVLKAAFKAIVLKPKPFEKQSKQEDFNVLIAFLDKGDEVIECSEISGLNVVFSRKLVEMNCADNNSFQGTVSPWFGLSELELIKIKATHTKNGKTHHTTTRVPVYFKGASVKATNPFEEEKYYLNEFIREGEVRFLLNEIYVITPEELNALLVSGEKERDLNVKKAKNGFDYIIEFNHRVNERDLSKGLELYLQGKDSLGNVIDEVQKVPLEEENPALSIAVLEPLPSEREFAFGQVFTLKAKILSNSKPKNKSLMVKCPEIGLEKELEFDSRRKEYFVDVVLPEPDFESRELLFRLTATGVVSGQEFVDYENLPIGLSNGLGVDFVYPTSEKIVVLDDGIGVVRVRVFQPNGWLFKKSELSAELLVDGNTQPVTLNYDAGKKLYYANLSERIPLGEHLVEVRLVGDFSGSDSVSVLVERDVFLFNLFSTAGIVFGILFVLLVLALVIRSVVRERGFLLEERERLLGLRKKHHYEFYKRHIGESELSEDLKRVNSGIKAIDSLLKRFSWLWVGFLKAFFRSGDYRKLPVFLQVSLLVNRLAGRRGEYSREEVGEAMEEEGYSERVIERVLNKLYK